MAKPKELKREESFIEVTKTYLIDGKKVPKSERETLTARVFATEPAHVSINLRQTLGIRSQYEPTAVGIMISVPCYTEELASVYKQTLRFAEKRMDTLLERIEHGKEGKKAKSRRR